MEKEGLGIGTEAHAKSRYKWNDGMLPRMTLRANTGPPGRPHVRVKARQRSSTQRADQLPGKQLTGTTHSSKENTHAQAFDVALL